MCRLEALGSLWGSLTSQAQYSFRCRGFAMAQGKIKPLHLFFCFLTCLKLKPALLVSIVSACFLIGRNSVMCWGQATGPRVWNRVLSGSLTKSADPADFEGCSTLCLLCKLGGKCWALSPMNIKKHVDVCCRLMEFNHFVSIWRIPTVAVG